MYDAFNLTCRNGYYILSYGDNETEYRSIDDSGDEIIENIDMDADYPITLQSRPGRGDTEIDPDELEELAMFLNAETGLEFIVDS